MCLQGTLFLGIFIAGICGVGGAATYAFAKLFSSHKRYNSKFIVESKGTE